MENETFETLLKKNRVVIERYINFRMPSTHDADDVIQETYLSAFRHFGEIRNVELFKPWILSIARNQCSLWYRNTYRHEMIPLDSLEETMAVPDTAYDDTVNNILRKLPTDSALILRLSMNGMKQSEIADKLSIPIGTVKSRFYRAKKLFRSVCPPEIKFLYEGGNTMEKKNYTHGFPPEMPTLSIMKTNEQVFDIRLEDESFIIPKIGNKCAVATYRYPDKKLAIVSNCYVPKKAIVHGGEAVKICRDTFNVRENKLYKNEAIWFTQLTDEYMRNLGTVKSDGDNEYPTLIYTFLEEDYDVIVNGNDRIHGVPVVLKENPGIENQDGIFLVEYNTRYTMGVYSVTIGARQFETVKVLNVQNRTLVTESYFDRNNRLVLMRCYETLESVAADDMYSKEFFERVKNNPAIRVNGVSFTLIEDRISEYAM